MRARVIVYQDKRGGWRWRFVVNGRVMADSGEGYTRRRQAWRAWDHFCRYVRSAGGGFQPYREYSTDPKRTPTKIDSAHLGRGVER